MLIVHTLFTLPKYCYICLKDNFTLFQFDKMTYLCFLYSSITVVQSYFIYWAGIESAVVHDGSPSVWSSDENTAVDGESTVYTVQEERVTAPPSTKHCFKLQNAKTNFNVMTAITLPFLLFFNPRSQQFI